MTLTQRTHPLEPSQAGQILPARAGLSFRSPLTPRQTLVVLALTFAAGAAVWSFAEQLVAVFELAMIAATAIRMSVLR